MRFCGACGSALPATGERAPAAPSPPGEAERRQLTVVFCDLVESTALSEQLDPETFREIMREYYDACATEIDRFGGHIAQYLGDGLLVYFGYPRAYEDDAARAVHAGLAIVRAIDAVNQRPGRDSAVRLKVRLGIHTGPVVAGAMSVAGRSEELAVGSTLNIAARLQAVAEPGTVVISDATHDLVQGFFVCEALGAQTLKGVSQPIAAYLVRHETEVRSRFDAAVARGLTPAVDRQHELEDLRESFDRVGEGHGEVVWIVGDAGIGKSRLLQMLREQTTGSAVWLVGRCLPYYQTSALFPVIDLVQRLLGFAPDDTAAERLQKLIRGVERYPPPRPDAVPLLATMLSLPVAEARIIGLTPERQKELTFETLLGVLFRVSAERPVVVVIEDLHWADPSTLDFLRLLLERAPAARLLVLLTHRPTFRPPEAAQPGTRRIVLDRLVDQDVDTMITNIAGERRLSREARRYVAEKSDGVPIFIEEMTRAALETDSPFESRPIPASLQDLLLARLDRLGTAKDLAQLAAVIGREFTSDLLRAVAETPEPKLEHDLAQLVDGGVLRRRDSPPTARYVFRHALIQDAAYGLLLTGPRRQYHQRVAETLASRFPEVAETQPELLARHFSEAKLVEPAVGYWLRAARRGVERSANVEAAGHARQGLELLARLSSSPERDGLELALQTALGSALMALQGYAADEVEAAFARAEVLCEKLGNQSQLFHAVLGLWTYYVTRADYVKGLELADRLLAMAHAQGQSVTLVVHAHYCLGFTRYFRGDVMAAHDILDAGAAVRCDPGDPGLVTLTGDNVRIHLLCFLALTLWHLGRPGQAVACGDDAIAFARQASHPYGLAFALVLGSFAAMCLRDVQRAKTLADKGLTIATDKGYRYLTLLGGFVRGWALAEEDNAEEGFEAMRRSVESVRASGARVGQTLLMVHLAESCLRRGGLDEGRRLLDDTRAAVEMTGEAFCEAELHRLRALAEPPAAEPSLLHALDVARQQRNAAQELRAATALAGLWRDGGRPGEARALLAPLYRRWVEGRDTADLVAALAVLESLA
jgi:class 3 adenylate cyclase/predicted ATPase